MKEYNKLVRDNIPQIVKRNGGVAHIRRIDSDEEYIQELIKKLLEEANEVAKTPVVEELADVKEVLEALAAALDISLDELDEVQQAKAEKNGKFDQRVYLIGTEG